MNPRYKIVSGDGMDEISKQVEFWLAKGWKFVGGVSVVHGQFIDTYYQAMSFGVSSEG
jgi:hypothetical protein